MRDWQNRGQRRENALTANWRFGAMAAVTRRKDSAKLKGSSPQKMYPMLPLRQAAGTLHASWRERGGESS